MPPDRFPRLVPQGDGAVTVQFSDEVSATAHALVTGFTQALDAAQREGAWPSVTATLAEWVAAYSSVTLILRPDARLSEAQAVQRDADLLALARATQPAQNAGRCWRLPVCFDADLAPDLAALAQARGLTVAAAIAHLVAARFQVDMIGFLPGFPYMGGLPAELAVPRLATPRRAVPARSIAVAGTMAGIYPWASPGGWHLVGRTPVLPFDVREPDPALLRAGDAVQFFAIDRPAFDALEAAAAVRPPDRSGWLNPQAGQLPEASP